MRFSSREAPLKKHCINLPELISRSTSIGVISMESSSCATNARKTAAVKPIPCAVFLAKLVVVLVVDVVVEVVVVEVVVVVVVEVVVDVVVVEEVVVLLCRINYT